MSSHKGKPSGKFAETKSAPGRKADYKRSGWPEDAPTQHVARARSRTRISGREQFPGEGAGRNRKAGGPG